jgi:hypothetical protein
MGAHYLPEEARPRLIAQIETFPRKLLFAPPTRLVGPEPGFGPVLATLNGPLPLTETYVSKAGKSPTFPIKREVGYLRPSS